MAEYPALPLFTDAYLSDTRHLTTAQHGAYLLMLMTAWRSPDCMLSSEDDYLSRICGMDKRTWAANKGVLLSFFKQTSQAKLFQKRLLDERNYVEGKRNKNSLAGKASALKRLNRGSTSVQPDLNVTSTPTPTPTPTPTVLLKDKALNNKEPPFHLPDWIPAEPWEAFIEVRQKQRAANTPKALKSLVTKLLYYQTKGHNIAEIIDNSVRNSWKDVYEPKGPPPAQRPPSKGEHGKAEVPTIVGLIDENGQRYDAKRYADGRTERLGRPL